jgi:hypothetical protein
MFFIYYMPEVHFSSIFFFICKIISLLFLLGFNFNALAILLLYWPTLSKSSSEN